MGAFLDSYQKAQALRRQAEQDAETRRLQAKAEFREEQALSKLEDATKFKGAISNMFMDNMSFQGQFVASPTGLEFESIPGGEFKAFPSITEALQKYKKIVKKYNQEPDAVEFNQLYDSAKMKYGGSLSEKFRTMVQAGYSNEAIGSAIQGNEALSKSFNTFLGTALAPELAPFVPEKPKGFVGGAAEEFGKKELGLAGARFFGAVKTGAGLKALTPGGLSRASMAKGSAAIKAKALDIGKDLIATKKAPQITKWIGSSAKSATGMTNAISSYIKKNGIQKFVGVIAKKAGPMGALKILGKGTLGALLTGSGVGTAAGLALDVMTVVDLYNIISEATKEAGKGETMKEALLGGEEPKVTPGTTY